MPVKPPSDSENDGPFDGGGEGYRDDEKPPHDDKTSDSADTSEGDSSDHADTRGHGTEHDDVPAEIEELLALLQGSLPPEIADLLAQALSQGHDTLPAFGSPHGPVLGMVVIRVRLDTDDVFGGLPMPPSFSGTRASDSLGLLSGFGATPLFGGSGLHYMAHRRMQVPNLHGEEATVTTDARGYLPLRQFDSSEIRIPGAVVNMLKALVTEKMREPQEFRDLAEFFFQSTRAFSVHVPDLQQLVEERLARLSRDPKVALERLDVELFIRVQGIVQNPRDSEPSLVTAFRDGLEATMNREYGASPEQRKAVLDDKSVMNAIALFDQFDTGGDRSANVFASIISLLEQRKVLRAQVGEE